MHPEALVQRLNYPLDVILVCMLWNVAYPLSLRHIEEMLVKLGVLRTIRRCINGPLSCCQCCKRRPVGASDMSRTIHACRIEYPVVLSVLSKRI